MKKVILVNGASSDIGKEIVQKFKKKDCILVLLGRNKNRILNAVGTIRGIDFIFETNYSEKSLKEIIGTIENNIGKIDVLINCIGIGIFKPTLKLTLEEYRNIFEVNFFYTISVSMCVLKKMKLNNNGLIINIDSIASKKVFRKGSAYCASKFALEAFFETLKEELKNTSIKICSIKLGLVNTKFFDKIKKNKYTKYLKEAIQPTDVSNIVEMIFQQSEFSNIVNVEMKPSKIIAKDLFHKLI